MIIRIVSAHSFGGGIDAEVGDVYDVMQNVAEAKIRAGAAVAGTPEELEEFNKKKEAKAQQAAAAAKADAAKAKGKGSETGGGS